MLVLKLFFYYHNNDKPITNIFITSFNLTCLKTNAIAGITKNKSRFSKNLGLG